MSDSGETDMPSTENVFIKEEHFSEDDDIMTEMMAQTSVKVEIEVDPLPSRQNPMKSKQTTSRSKQTHFACDECDFTTLYRHSLNNHKSSHRPEKPYKCEYCGYVTKYQTSLKRHITYIHLHPKPKKQPKNSKKSTLTSDTPNSDTITSDAPNSGTPLIPKELRLFGCELCDYSSKYKANLQIHMRKHTSEKPFECPDCDYKSAYPHHLVKHKRTHLKDPSTLYTCEECKFASRFEGRLERHLIKIHKKVVDRPFKCPFCDYSAKWKWKLTLHMKRRTREDKMICSVCEFTTFNKCEMNNHEETHYPDVDLTTLNGTIKTIKCKLCDFECNDSGILMLHENDHFGNNSELTSDVPKKLPDDFQILTKEDDKSFKCDICGYTSRFKASIERHQFRVHTDSNHKPFKCNNCSFSTKTKEQLHLHNKRSVSRCILSCFECEFKSNFKCQYGEHRQSHNEFQCHHCPVRFRSKKHLVRHLEALKGEAKFKCRFCNYSSSRKHTVYCHELTHTGEKPFKCNLCNFSTVRRIFLLHHLRKHKIEPIFNEKDEGVKCNVQIDTDIFNNHDIDGALVDPLMDESEGQEFDPPQL